jgi:hypothetical protein
MPPRGGLPYAVPVNFSAKEAAASYVAILKNKLAKSGVFFDSEKQPSFSPRLPPIPPRSHHKNTITKHPFFRTPHRKTRVKPGKDDSTGA